METVNLSKANLLNTYNKADKAKKEFLEDLYGKETFMKVVDLDSIRTIDDVIAAHEVDDDLRILLNYSGTNEVMRGAKYFALASMIANVFNQGWVADWNNDNEAKWYAWWYLNITNSDPSGFRLDYAYFDYTTSIVGSRLCLKDESTCKKVARLFPDVYMNLLKFNHQIPNQK